MMNKDRRRQSPNFINGAFRNSSPTPMMVEGVSYLKVIRETLNRPKTTRPSTPLPSFHSGILPFTAKPSITWFGHSSYLIQVDGKNILVDPVFSGHASPVPWLVKSFKGTNNYIPGDFPVIDVLIITHNHYDHLDRETIRLLKSKIRWVYTSLGAARSIPALCPEIITELDWYESAAVAENMEITALPARHFSGRGLRRGTSLWASFKLKTKGNTFYIGGDSGYDDHFKKIGEQYGPFDIAILECGQYNLSWPYIHMMPEQTVQAAIDLNATVLLPVHWGKFGLANHPWDEPISRVVKNAHERNMKITTPLIGETIILDEYYPDAEWWKQIH